jgi:alpha-N-arabinofuranosidase
MQKYVINTKKQKAHIDRNIYGHFSEHLGRCIYEGLYVGEDSNIPNIDGMRTDVVEALKAMGLPLLRWPGGCFADEYHWKDGIGPKENRKKMINTHWGGVVEDNSFGTHEFMRLCELLECEPYINGNVGSGTVQEMSEWVEYMTFDGLSPMAKLREENGQKDAWKVKYFGVGNENWGCGGNMRPEYYADLYRRYQTYTRNYGDNKLFKIAGGPNVDDYNWTKVLMEIAGPYMDGLSLHFYTFVNSWEDKGSATQMTEKDYYRVLKNTWRMEELVTKHSHIMDKYDPQKRVALVVDEWGTWYEVEPGTNPGFLYQQNSMRDALVAGINLNIFNKHADRVRMANIAQLVNVLQSVILTEGEKMIKTPTYHVFDMYQEHQDNHLLESYITTPELDIDGVKVPAMTESASVNASGHLVLTLCNLDLHEERLIDADTFGFNPKKVSGHIIRGAMDDYNTFEEPEVVKKEAFDQVKLKESGFTMTLPTCSVVRLILE